ncbi:hypothetical protein F3Y22_tig00109983pilonHSYRG00017 [Hibiscus syriacus]|uniref:Carbonic anhydrase n=1 Tax=Hibiscus syriacus TaxID=106335 RepID=A0A6A3BQW3_HIBSY|nr:hypothetical protein F3Y22_tig00109983pilonHSYRG00017 [Hibiscus syriacus]
MALRVYSVVFLLSLLVGIASAIDGKRQSPINIQRNMTVHNKQLKPLARKYKPANATLVNKGFSVGVRFEEDAGELWIDAKSYTLKQVHWHLPSEHRIDSQQFAAELHMVHRAPDNSTAVVAVLYQEANAADPFICRDVNWSILGKVMSISKEQIAAMDTPLNSDCKRNARPCQPLNGREVDLYDELSC